MIRLDGQLRCRTPDEAETVRAHRSEHIRLTLAEPACLSFDIADTADPLTFLVTETFRDQAGFDAHQMRTKRSPWFARTAGIPRDFQIREVDG
jgi:quinol monooxygenase YgiN